MDNTKKCIFHGGQLRYQAQDNLIGLLACYLANKVCAAAVDRNHIVLETMILFKTIAKFLPKAENFLVAAAQTFIQQFAVKPLQLKFCLYTNLLSFNQLHYRGRP